MQVWVGKELVPEKRLTKLTPIKDIVIKWVAYVIFGKVRSIITVNIL